MSEPKKTDAQDLTKLSLNQQRQVLDDAESAHKAVLGAWRKRLKSTDKHDLPQIAHLTQNMNEVAGGFKYAVDDASHMFDTGDILRQAQAQLLNSPYPEIQDRAAKDIDATIADIVETTRDDTPNFTREDLARLFLCLSKHYKAEDISATTNKMMTISKAENTPNLATTLVISGLVEGKNDIALSLADAHPIRKLTDDGENMLVRLQQHATRVLLNNISRSPEP